MFSVKDCCHEFDRYLDKKQDSNIIELFLGLNLLGML